VGVQKPALGRKLETLMSRAPVQAPAGETEPASAQAPARGAGVRSLIRGNRAKAASERLPAPSTRMRIPRWYLFGGDLLLVALALIIAYKSPGPLTWKQTLFCTLVVVLGACLAIIAICAGESPQEGARPKIGPFSNGRRE
jgi:hypothetical protein